MDKMRMDSFNGIVQNIEHIGALFPNCVTETVGADGRPKKPMSLLG